MICNVQKKRYLRNKREVEEQPTCNHNSEPDLYIKRMKGELDEALTLVLTVSYIVQRS